LRGVKMTEEGKKYFALTFVSKDRYGIVADVSKVLYDNGFNLEDSSSTLLRGFFSMILIVATREDYTEEEIKCMYDCLEDISISVRKMNGSDATIAEGLSYVVSVYGSDKPGIVYKVTDYLRSKNINVIDLQTKVAGKENKPIYIMILEILVPENYQEEEWIVSLKALSDKMGTDIHIRQIETYEF